MQELLARVRQALQGPVPLPLPGQAQPVLEPVQVSELRAQETARASGQVLELPLAVGQAQALQAQGQQI